MALTVKPLPYGCRDIKLTPYLANGTLDTTSVDLPASRTLSFTEAEDFQELRGDDSVITSRGSGPSVDWDLEAGGISLEAWKVLSGGTITETGTTPNQIKQYRKLTTQSRPFFKVEGQAISDSGGDFHVILYKCRATGDLEGELNDGEFWLTAASGQAFGTTVSAVNNVLYDFIQNESETAIA